MAEREHPVVVDLAGEEPVVAWPLLLRDRLARRVPPLRRTPRVLLVTVLVGLFATGFSITILAVSLGDVARDLGSSRALLTWTVTGPFLVMALAMPLLGNLGDVIGHRRVYLVGLTVFAVATALTALAWSGLSLVVLRLVAAGGGAAIGPASMALIMRAFPTGERVKAMGWWSLVGAGGPVVGLVVGGPVVDAIGWRGIFAVQAPLAAIAAIGAMRVLRETPRGARVPIDWPGVASLGTAATTLLLGLNLAGSSGWGSPLVIALLAAAPVALIVFVRIERATRHPLMPLELFASRDFSAALVARTAVNFAYMGGFIITPFLVRQEFGFSVAAASLAMVLRPLSNSTASPLSGYAALRFGERRVATFGTSLLVLSMVSFVAATAWEALALVFVGLFVSGVAAGAAMPSLITVAANSVADERLGVASAAQQMCDAIGAVMGIQVLATVQEGAAGSLGFGRAYAVGAVVAVIAVLAARLVSASRATR
ncbi:MAG: MFS transporter [Acidimicrobiia bacterium]